MKCLVCSTKFNNVQEHVKHFQICKQSLKCEKCEQCSDQVRKYHAHVEVCNGLDKYKCYICQVEFTNCKKCLDHLYKHNKFKCMMCNFQFKSVQALTKHCDKEHPKRQYEKCNTFCLSDDGLRKHILKYHKL